MNSMFPILLVRIVNECDTLLIKLLRRIVNKH